jgi:hypothetical protein
VVTPTTSTAIHTSQNSTQPRAIPYVASSDPARIQASVVGPHEPIRSSSA